AVATLPELVKEKKEVNFVGRNARNKPAALFNGMVNPVAGYGIKGALWYQGEANRSHGKYYTKWLATMVEGWRKLWNQPDFPFYFIQLPAYKYDGKENARFLREAQLKAVKEIP